MLALAYDAALRREELCSLGTDDLDPAHRTIRVRAETTKNRRERVVPYSAATGVLLSEYLRHRAAVSRARGPLFLSESRRNHGQPLTLWTWSKAIRKIAVAADLPRFSTHTTRHLCLTDLARMGWELHAIASFVGHRSTESTLKYIHLSGRDLAGKLARSMDHIHAWRAGQLTAIAFPRRACGDACVPGGRTAGRAPARPWSLEAVGYDRSAALTTAEQNALEALGWELRRWPHRWRDPGHGDWPALRRLVLPFATARDCLEVPEDNDFQRRSAADAVALVLHGCAARRMSFWAWDAAAWAEVLGPSRKVFQGRYPGWADSSARTYAIALAYVFGFTELNLLGNVGRAAVAGKVFGSARVNDAVGQVTSVLHGWGHRSPQVTVRTESLVCHALLLNRSPLLAELSAEVLQDLRSNTAVPYSLRQNVHSLHRALAALGLTSPPPPARLAPPPVEGVAAAWAGWVQRWHDTSPLAPCGRKGRRNQMLRKLSDVACGRSAMSARVPVHAL
jgi:integrase-like protein